MSTSENRRMEGNDESGDPYIMTIAQLMCDFLTKRSKRSKGNKLTLRELETHEAQTACNPEKETPQRKAWLKMLTDIVNKLKVKYFFWLIPVNFFLLQ
jgi:hypothetical protein